MSKPVGRLEVKVSQISEVGIQTVVKEIEQLIEDYSEKKMLYGCIQVKVVDE